MDGALPVITRPEARRDHHPGPHDHRGAPHTGVRRPEAGVDHAARCPSIRGRLAERYRPSTVRRYYAVLRAILSAAVEADVLPKSPCRGIDLPEVVAADKPLLDRPALDRLAQAMPESGVMVYLAGVLGLRWGECAGLRVKRLDFFARTITVAEQISQAAGQFIAGEPKTKAARRTVTVPGPLMDMLAEHLARRGRPGPEEYVFVSPDGGPLWYTNWWARQWVPTVKAAGLDGLTFHTLRHSATTAMVREGVHPRVIQHRLGHRKAELSMSVYAHVPTELDKAASSLLEERFFGRSGTRTARPTGSEGS